MGKRFGNQKIGLRVHDPFYILKKFPDLGNFVDHPEGYYKIGLHSSKPKSSCQAQISANAIK
jgi:hypothetical protein